MVEETKNDGADDPINMLLEKALTRQRDKMMENFSHILQHLSIASATSSSSCHFGGTSPFKVQSSFVILLFESVGTEADPGFNATTMHQQNPNYRPFRQHLRSR